jgi:sulfur carrier protein ThiS
MVTVSFTYFLQRYVECPTVQVTARTVREALHAVFERTPRARGYILDDQGALRQHVVVFVNGRPIRDRAAQGDELADGADVYVMQALSGG